MLHFKQLHPAPLRSTYYYDRVLLRDPMFPWPCKTCMSVLSLHPLPKLVEDFEIQSSILLSIPLAALSSPKEESVEIFFPLPKEPTVLLHHRETSSKLVCI